MGGMLAMITRKTEKAQFKEERRMTRALEANASGREAILEDDSSSSEEEANISEHDEGSSGRAAVVTPDKMWCCRASWN